jgi:transposase
MTLASIVHCNVKGTIYLYESTGHRDKINGGKVKNIRKLIGKIDKVTGESIYKPEYLTRMRLAGTPIEISSSQKQFSVDDIKNSSTRDYGLFYLLKSIAERNGLMSSLQSASPEHWKELFMLAEHLVPNGDPFMYCQEWLEGTVSLDCGKLNPQRISELLSEISFAERETFYKNWAAKVTENDYLALDITSTSSYSELIPEIEWGYNRDGEDLPQINLCMLFGENSRLPVYQTAYSGSLKDVSTLQSTLAEFGAIADSQSITAVMDKGFYSYKNITAMLKNNQKFLIAVPFTPKFVKAEVDEVRDTIQTYGNAIRTSSSILYGTTRQRNWHGGISLFAHIYYNPHQELAIREKNIAMVNEMEKAAKREPDKYLRNAKYTKFLDFSKIESGYTITVKEDALSSLNPYCGWLVILTNRKLAVPEVISIYRAKDVVEKGFEKLKNSLDLGRLRVHSSNNAQNKIFTAFIALILLSEIHKTMSDKELYEKGFTITRVLRTLAKLKLHTINGVKILSPATKEQKLFFDSFGISQPWLV